MLAEERRTEILALVEKRRTITVPELSELLGISESTIRRDLTQLDRMKRLNKVHGGATALDAQYVLSDQTLSEKKLLHREQKMQIGAYAASLIRKDDFVFIDAGTSTDCLVDAIEETGARYVTNSIAHAHKLLQKGCRVIVPGGELKPTTEALVGAEAIELLLRYHFTIGFWGANGVSPETGFTTPESAEAAIKRVSMAQTKKKYILCDSSKFSLISPISFAAFDEAVILTDEIRDAKYKKYKNIKEVAKR
ncbi:MAG: DeoR/GlpR family DNA-binding transcription regulator [Lachnospiraceae bacterium]|nr:DeoR/GlpR family DNA-binding transcription regulator [Lachnospiraceae bacterium]